MQGHVINITKPVNGAINEDQYASEFYCLYNVIYRTLFYTGLIHWEGAKSWLEGQIISIIVSLTRVENWRWSGIACRTLPSQCTRICVSPSSELYLFVSSLRLFWWRIRLFTYCSHLPNEETNSAPLFFWLYLFSFFPYHSHTFVAVVAWTRKPRSSTNSSSWQPTQNALLPPWVPSTDEDRIDPCRQVEWKWRRNR